MTTSAGGGEDTANATVGTSRPNRHRTGEKATIPTEFSRYAVQSAVKTFEVLFAFRGADRPLAVPDVAQRLGMSRNQVYRCFKTLEAVGLVREGVRGFSLTEKLLELVPALESPSLLSVAAPLLVQLRNQTGETVNLCTPVGQDEVEIVASYPTLRSVGLLPRVGTRSYLHAGSVPKAVLAHLPAEAVERFLARLPSLPRYTDRTVIDPERLREELALTRERGYSISDQDFEEGARGVGVAILGPDGLPVGGLSVGGPAERLDDAALERYADLAMATAAAISRRLGYLPGRTTGCGGPPGEGAVTAS
ncbi:MAG: IclR family transcriptional regulator [Firmicutes bacterium]|nr:IclR family transcriptional regulator [Bacillota bacterium]